MQIDLLEQDGARIAEVRGEDKAIKGMPDVLDLIGEIAFNRGISRVLLRRELIDESFFDLKSGFAGELAQKFTTYRLKLAVVGDFSWVTSLALKAYIRESNLKDTVFFTPRREAALNWLARG